MKGYKVFNSDWTCKEMQYEIGKSYEIEENSAIHKEGFHFCKNAMDCFSYYEFDIKNKVAEVEAYGKIETAPSGGRYCTDKIKIVRELNWQEVLDLVNTGMYCTGLGNSGNKNTGDWNTGHRNTGDNNSGDINVGDKNSGDFNIGDLNTGNRNTGSCNSGDSNTGHRNTGYYNSGTRNSGDYNKGHYNTGDWNIASGTTGCFNTVDAPIMFFDMPTNITLKEWRNSNAYRLLSRIELHSTKWIPSGQMTDTEKKNLPTHETTGGYLKLIDNSDCCTEWWESLTNEEKGIIKAMPNFDKEKFCKITGIPEKYID